MIGLLSALALSAWAAPKEFPTADAAALHFIDEARREPEQRIEYCAWILELGPRRYVLSERRSGDMNRCPNGDFFPKNTAASVHTHPIWGAADDVAASGQVFSEGDFGHAEAQPSKPTYLGAPAGHVLRYDPGGTVCTRMFITRNFTIVRDLPRSVKGRLELNPGEKKPLLTQAGRPIPRPSYCREPTSS